MFDVNMVMMRAWNVVAGAGRTRALLGTSVSGGGGDVKKRAPSCVYQRREGQVRAVVGACVTVAAWCTWHGGTAWLGVARHVDGCGVGCCVGRGEGKRVCFVWCGVWRWWSAKSGLGWVWGVVGWLVEGRGVAGNHGCAWLVWGRVGCVW